MDRIIDEIEKRINGLMEITNKTESDKEKISYLVSTQHNMIIVNGLMAESKDK